MRGAGRLARWWRFLVTHQVPVGGGPVHAPRTAPGRATVGVVSCHVVAHGYGDQVVTRVERALDRRGHVAGPLAAVDDGAPVVVVVHSGRRSRPALRGTEVAALAGRTVGLVTYGPFPLPDVTSPEVLRAELASAGARVVDPTATVDVARLHRPGATSRATAPADAEDRRDGPDPFGLLTLELVLDDLLGSTPAPVPDGPRGAPPGGPEGEFGGEPPGGRRHHRRKSGSGHADPRPPTDVATGTGDEARVPSEEEP